MVARVADNDTPLALGGNVVGNQVIRVRIPAEATAGNADKWVIGRAEFDLKVVRVTWIPEAAVNGANTNNFTLAVINAGKNGAGTTAVTTTKTYASGTNSAARVAEAFALHATEANREVSRGDVIVLNRTVNGTGLASPNGVIEVQVVTQDQ